MNVFILNTGRCGSSTFIKACEHITNFSCGHETLLSETGNKRFDYPNNHIEADNRLSWLLGRLDTRYGQDAFYVHLSRNNNDTVKSFTKRINFGILKAYEQGILMHDTHQQDAANIASDYALTVNENIKLFLKGKPNQLNFKLENAKEDFEKFWLAINAEGDLSLALKEWDISYNAS